MWSSKKKKAKDKGIGEGCGGVRERRLRKGCKET